MKLRQTCSRKFLLSALVPLLFAACGDDVTNTDVTNVTGAKTVADLSKAGKCDSASVGELVLNSEDGGLYVCNGKKWLSTAGEGAGDVGCELNSVTVDGVDGVEIVCGNAKDTVLNGAKGDKGNPGNPGNPGAAGTICSAQKIDGVGVEITCDGTVIDTLENGAKGDPGDAGTICSAQKIDGVGVEITCDGVIVDTLKNGAPGDAGTSCTAEPYDDGIETGVVVSCDGVAIDTILNGAKGDPGDPGASCTGRTIVGVGIEVSCGGVVIDTLKNGAAGASCTGRSIAGVGVEISCGGVVIDTVTAPSLEICGNRLYDVGSQFCDIRDTTVYKWVKIGSQIWMAENLNYVYKVNGATYRNYCYNDSAQYCAKYGRLYTWAVAMDTAVTGCGYKKNCDASAGRVQGICPDGWHLPDSTEIEDLFTAVGGKSTAGTMLKTTEGWYNNGNGADAYGFSALPSGSMLLGSGTIGSFSSESKQTFMWSSKASNTDYSWYLNFTFASTAGYLTNNSKKYAFPVRCVKN